MLILSQKPREKIIIGNNITLAVLVTSGSRASVGIDAGLLLGSSGLLIDEHKQYLDNYYKDAP